MLNTENLNLLAAKLENLPADYAHFNMANFIIDENDDYVELEPALVTKKVIHNCGTCACAIGHAPTIKGLDARKGEDWNEYCQRVFGFNEDDTAWDFVFGPMWAYRDGQDTAHAAASRLRYLANHRKAPDEWGGYSL